MPGTTRLVRHPALDRRLRLRLIPCALALAGLPLTALATDLSGTINVSAPQTYSDAVTLTGDTYLQSSNGSPITFQSTVNGSYGLDIATGGTTTFASAVGLTTPLAAISTGSGAVFFNGGTGTVTTLGGQTYLGPVSFVSSTQFQGGSIAFMGTLDGAAPLNVSSRGIVTLGGVVGASSALQGLDISAGSLDILSSLQAQGPVALDIATGGITQSAPFTFAAPASINAHAGAIILNNAGNAFNAPLTLQNTGANDVAVASTSNLFLDSVNVGSGTFTASGAGIHQTGSFPFIQAAGAGPATFTDTAATSGGITLAGSSNDFTGTVNLSSGSVCQIVDANALTLGSLACNPLIATSIGPLNLGYGEVHSQLQATTIGGDITQSGPLVAHGPSILNAGT
jgi:hypothetical protein